MYPQKKILLIMIGEGKMFYFLVQRDMDLDKKLYSIQISNLELRVVTRVPPKLCHIHTARFPLRSPLTKEEPVSDHWQQVTEALWPSSTATSCRLFVS